MISKWRCNACTRVIARDAKPVVVCEMLACRRRNIGGPLTFRNGDVIHPREYAMVCSKTCRSFILQDPSWDIVEMVDEEDVVRHWPYAGGSQSIPLGPISQNPYSGTPAVPDLPEEPVE